jgi:hypothetical protein
VEILEEIKYTTASMIEVHPFSASAAPAQSRLTVHNRV